MDEAGLADLFGFPLAVMRLGAVGVTLNGCRCAA